MHTPTVISKKIEVTAYALYMCSIVVGHVWQKHHPYLATESSQMFGMFGMYVQ